MIKKPHLFFLVIAILSFTSSFFTNDNHFKINFSYTHFKILHSQFLQICTIYFILISINYYALFWLKKTPKKWLTISHIVLQITSFILLFIDYNNFNFELISILVFSISFLLHIINFFTSLLIKTE